MFIIYPGTATVRDHSWEEHEATRLLQDKPMGTTDTTKKTSSVNNMELRLWKEAPQIAQILFIKFRKKLNIFKSWN